MLERIKQLKEAILLEQKAELDRFKTLIDEQSIANRIAEGVTLYPIAFNDFSYNLFDELLLEFQVNPEQVGSQFSTSGNVQLFSETERESVNGILVKLKNNVLTISLGEADRPEWIKGGKLGLNALPDSRTSNTQIATLEKIEKGELRIAHQFYLHAQKKDYAVETQIFDNLNPSQNKAASEIMSANPFHIVHGPPGTGKTKTLVNTINEMAKKGQRILVAAPSNAAVDHITRELAKSNEQVLRLGNSYKISDSVLPYTLNYKLLNSPLTDVVKRLKKDAESIRKKAFRYVRNFGKEEYEERKRLRQELKTIRKDIRKIERNITTDLIQQAPIITGTFISLQTLTNFEIDFDIVCVDEAGQALEPSIWAVAQFAPRLVLAGDPLQLPPTLFTTEAAKLGLSVSLIEKGIALGIPTTLLNVQYRMNDKIMQFSNQQFYKNELTSSPEVSGHQINNAQYAPIEFIDTAGCGYDEVNDESGGIANPGEAELIVKRLSEFNDDSLKIGVISPYRKQVENLKEIIDSPGVTCQTIDSFQGQERQVIIVSLVRSNTEGNIGFLADYRRMNVALTRARQKLIVIGDSATIAADRFYANMIEYIEQHGTYRSGWEFFE